MRSCCRSVCFLLLMDSKLPPRVGRAWRPIGRVSYKPPQLTDKEHSEASNSITKQSNITVTKNGIKSAHVCSIGPVPDPMVAFPPEKAKVLQSLESDADAEMSSSSASEGDTLEYDMSEDLEDTPENVCPTTPPPPSTARKR
ncbi:hypothetical protein AVEN_85969-1 [Araneus ventricosus]|uniref:Uncharacterized protein n=1 Tax=Araneus ventricosus TaxID=182803 RepID=A0A4Y2G6P6_ARAVE|nr:hypothetical protein AVEN_85969-1 [Araneus ventricosus]